MWAVVPSCLPLDPTTGRFRPQLWRTARGREHLRRVSVSGLVTRSRPDVRPQLSHKTKVSVGNWRPRFVCSLHTYTLTHLHAFSPPFLNQRYCAVLLCDGEDIVPPRRELLSYSHGVLLGSKSGINPHRNPDRTLREGRHSHGNAPLMPPPDPRVNSRDIQGTSVGFCAATRRNPYTRNQTHSNDSGASAPYQTRTG